MHPALATLAHDTDPRLRFYFIGVTTAQSSAVKLFPLWMTALGRADVRLVGIDLPLDATPEQYRAVVGFIQQDERSLGGLVTTHKINVLAAARDLFDALDTYAALCGEVSCIAKRGGQLLGYAKDPISSALALRDLLLQGHWANTRGLGQVLCLGAGGAGMAIVLALLTQSPTGLGDWPAHITVTDRNAERLTHLRAMLAQVDGARTGLSQTHLILNSEATVNDTLVHALPAGSLVINATGMGKDLAGSPVSTRCVFPQCGVVWELNYRGALGFLKLAQAQAQSRQLTVAAGWRYFLHGWSQVVGEVLQVAVDADALANMTA